MLGFGLLRDATSYISRAANLAVILAPAAASGAVCAILDVKRVLHRRAWRHFATSLVKQGRAIPRWLSCLAPRESGSSWFAWGCSKILSRRLRQAGPLPALLARWVAVCRPDLALINGPVVQLVALLRDHEFGGAIGRSAAPSDQQALAHAEGQLLRAFGPRWESALQLDPLPIGADSVVAAYRAVLNEDALLELQMAQERQRRSASGAAAKLLAAVAGAASSLGASQAQLRRRLSAALGGVESVPKVRKAGTSSIAAGSKARSAVVRIRREGVADMALVDLGLARHTVRLLRLLKLLGPSAEEFMEDFAAFAEEQLDLRCEAALLCQARVAAAAAALHSGGGLALPRLFGRATADVLIVSLEEGVSLAEVLQRPYVRLVDEGEAATRACAARRLALAFWSAILGSPGVLLGGLSPSSVLLRVAASETRKVASPAAIMPGAEGVDGQAVVAAQELAASQSLSGDMEEEVVLMRCGLAYQVEEHIKRDLRALAAALYGQGDGPECTFERLRALIHDYLQPTVCASCSEGSAEGASGGISCTASSAASHEQSTGKSRGSPALYGADVVDVEGFVTRAAELLAKSSNAAPGPTAEKSPPVRGAALLQRGLSLCEAHGVRVGTGHLRVAAAAAAVHALCARLDPAQAGYLLDALRITAATLEDGS
eukprot:TRINITY_DN30955_c0_g1_i3.p1 TRINITY_DN30955_c0_g1~~TRINITY_DN30955_c0_g1_i3.p1  ORF type:complete len:661 (-),score=141.62 TRINITY_DN30955_c0_g1_i3:110-2092(-)